MTYPFYIAHATAGRTRIRWAGDAADKGRIEELAATMVKIPGVVNAEARMTTGSIIIEHEEIDWSELEPQFTELLPVHFTSAPAPSSFNGLDVLNQGLDEMDGMLKSLNMDRNSFALLLLSFLAIAQAVRGQVLMPSTSFLWYAFDVLSRARGNTDKPVEQISDSVNNNSVAQSAAAQSAAAQSAE